ncbi:hypothetical protein FS749_011476 [Ceratobasidium sp. UAMH 11750]|nr:hypothetical protein FS749_011476 [Ceratobasidium sp. UAMH 11750]
MPTEHTYWDSLCSIPTVDLLAHLGLVLGSIVPNSMAKECSMLMITKLNSPDRASQKVSTLIDMTTIRQHYKRKEKQNDPSVGSFWPTTWFADLPQPVLNVVQADSPVAPLKIDQQTLADATEWFKSALGLGQLMQDEHEETPAPQGRSMHHFEVKLTDRVSLSSKLLAEVLIGGVDANTKRSHSPEPSTAETQPPQKRQKVDISSLEY